MYLYVPYTYMYAYVHVLPAAPEGTGSWIITGVLNILITTSRGAHTMLIRVYVFLPGTYLPTYLPTDQVLNICTSVTTARVFIYSVIITRCACSIVYTYCVIYAHLYIIILHLRSSINNISIVYTYVCMCMYSCMRDAYVRTL